MRLRLNFNEVEIKIERMFFMKLKRKMMCFVALALVVLLTMSAATPESTSTVAEEFSSFDVFASEFGEEFAINYFRTLELLDSLYDSLPQDRMGRTLYPNNFGGQYINDTGELVILVVQGSLASETEHNFMHSLSTDRVIIREVEFAYNCLRSALGLLRTAISNSYDCVAALNVDTIAFNVRHNEVRVYLAKYTEYHIDVFKNAILDAPFLVFNQSPGIASLDYSSVELMTPAYDNTTMRVQPRPALVRPGDGIYLRNPSGRFVASGSVGYRASMSVPGLGHMNGFVTAAHLGPIAFGRTLRPNDRIYNSNEVHIGTVRVVQLEGIDTAFFSVETDIIDSSNTWFGNVLGTIADVRASADM